MASGKKKAAEVSPPQGGLVAGFESAGSALLQEARNVEIPNIAHALAVQSQTVGVENLETEIRRALYRASFEGQQYGHPSTVLDKAAIAASAKQLATLRQEEAKRAQESAAAIAKSSKQADELRQELGRLEGPAKSHEQTMTLVQDLQTKLSKVIDDHRSRIETHKVVEAELLRSKEAIAAYMQKITDLESKLESAEQAKRDLRSEKHAEQKQSTMAKELDASRQRCKELDQQKSQLYVELQWERSQTHYAGQQKNQALESQAYYAMQHAQHEEGFQTLQQHYVRMQAAYQTLSVQLLEAQQAAESQADKVTALARVQIVRI